MRGNMYVNKKQETEKGLQGGREWGMIMVVGIWGGRRYLRKNGSDGSDESQPDQGLIGAGS